MALLNTVIARLEAAMQRAAADDAALPFGNARYSTGYLARTRNIPLQIAS
ncbi:hypothetical protein [Nocardia carnea]|nr:hypothetical protein [Nocardia carnea]